MINEINLKNFEFEHKHDIIYFNGSLLSLCNSSLGKLLFNWVDCTEDYNKWLLIPIEKDTLLKYYEKEISLKQIITNNDYVFIADIDRYINIKRIEKIDINNLKEEYLPSDDSYFDEDICVRVEI